MKTAPFDLEIALAGHPLVTRDGRPVRNFAAREDLGNVIYPYQAQVGSELCTYTRAGGLLQTQEDPLDLFLAIEDTPTQPSPRFQVGDIVRHRASGTRGVVVRVNEYQTESPRYDVSTEFGDRTSTLVKEVVLEPWTPPTYGPSPVLKRILEDRDYSDLT